MAIDGGVSVTGFIAPTGAGDKYPVIDPIYGIDGLRNLTGGTEMLYTGGTGITLERRRAGMIVGINTGDYYKLNNQPWNGTINDWTRLNLIGGGDYLALSGGTVTGGTIFTSGLTANTISATTYLGVNTLYTNNGVLSDNRTVNLSGNSITFSGYNFYIGTSAPTPTLFSISEPQLGVGTVNVVSGSNIVTGNTTQFTNTFNVGNLINISETNSSKYYISAITNNNNMTIVYYDDSKGVTNIPYTGTSGNNLKYYHSNYYGPAFSVNGNGNVNISRGALNITTANYTALTVDNNAFTVSSNNYNTTSTVSNGVSIWNGGTLTYPNNSYITLYNGNVSVGSDILYGDFTLSLTTKYGSVFRGTRTLKFSDGTNIISDVNNNHALIFNLPSTIGDGYKNHNSRIPRNPREVSRYTYEGNFLLGGNFQTTDTSLFSIRQNQTGIGLLGLTSGSTIVTGDNTQFTNTFRVGNYININGFGSYQITAIYSNTSLSIDTAYTGNGTNGIVISGYAYSGSPNVTTGGIYAESYFSTNDSVTISGEGFNQTFKIFGFAANPNYPNGFNNGVGLQLDSNFTGVTGTYNLINYSSKYGYTYTLSGGQRFSINGNGNVAFGTNISGGTSSGMWYDAGNNALNIGNTASQNVYKLLVNGDSKVIDGLYGGQLLPPTGLTATTGTTGFLSAGTYYYTVEAVDIFGRKTTPSNEIVVKIPDGITGGSINLSWNLVTGATFYYVCRSLNGSGNQNQKSNTIGYTNVTDLSTTSGSTPATSGLTHGFISFPSNSYISPYSIESPTTYNSTSKIQILDGNITSTGGATFIANSNTNSDVKLTLSLYQNGFNTNNVNSTKAMNSNKLVLQGLAWESKTGPSLNTGYLQVSNISNNQSPTIDKLSFFVGSSNIPITGSTEIFNLQSNGKINGYLSDSFTLSASSITNGDVTLFSGSTHVYGNMANFKSRFKVGDELNTGIYGSYIITTITSDNYLNINIPYSGAPLHSINVAFISGSTTGYTSSSEGYGQTFSSAFAPDYRGTFTAGTNSDIYTVTGANGGNFYFTPAFTSDTTGINTSIISGIIVCPITVYSRNNIPYYVTGSTVFNVNANGNATLNGKLTVTSGITGTSASVGTAKFTSGVVTLTNTCITSSSKVFLTVTGPSGSVGIPTRSGTTTNSMQIVSLTAGSTAVQTGDNSTFDYWIIN